MIQRDLITDTPRARRTDPQTSHIAADEVRETGRLRAQQNTVLEFVQRFPNSTSAELADYMAQERGGHWTDYRPMFGRRLKELTPIRIEAGTARRCRITGRAGSKRVCTTYRPAGQHCTGYQPS